MIRCPLLQVITAVYLFTGTGAYGSRSVIKNTKISLSFKSVGATQRVTRNTFFINADIYCLYTWEV